MANEFIGIEALTTIAEKVGTQIFMGPAYVAPDLISRLKIKVISGVQYKQVETVLIRKGGITRRKVVGQPNVNNIGFLQSRPLIAKLSWTVVKGNTDQFVETNFGVHATGDYPISTAQTEAIMKTYAEDLTANLFFGESDNDQVEEKKWLSLYDGFHKCIANDVDAGLISKEAGNLIECDAIEAPTSGTDTSAFDTYMEVYGKLHPALRQQPNIYCYCSIQTGINIADAYTNKKHGNMSVQYQGNGDWKVPETQNVTVVPTDAFGKGDLLVFTVAENFQYGVDSENNQTNVRVKVGSDEDLSDILFQIQSIQGTRLLNPTASCFAKTNGTIANALISGDYQKTKVVVTLPASGEGSVKVNGTAYTEPVEFAENTTLTLTAENGSKTFKQWSTGETTATITKNAKGNYMVFTPIFE